MTVFVNNNLENAVRKLSRQRLADGLGREVKVHQIAKPSERKRYKAFLADRRRQKALAKKDRREAQ